MFKFQILEILQFLQRTVYVNLSIVWILPYFGKDIKKQPLSYFSHLFGHEGENSILSYLKSEGLALSLSAGPDHELFSFSNLDVSIELT